MNKLSETVIGCAFTVHNTLGVGFVEKVYENALVHELNKADLKFEQQKRIAVSYDNRIVGEYQCDILVDDLIIIELKAVRTFDEVHIAQCMNYLRASGLRLCLLLNFGTPKVQIKRIVNKI